ncbi:MAG: tyrosine-protein phosphatase [Solirubrobacteraceae bacterium]
MIDLHCHLLPGIDDGPATLEHALALARAAAAEGIGATVATPHVSWTYRNDASRIEAGVAALRSQLAAHGVPLTVLAGAEIAMTYAADTPHEQLRDLTLGDSSWLLLEPPFAPVATGFDALAVELMEQGYRVLVAHPERCAGLHRDPSIVTRLVRSGALTSITAGSLAGRFGGTVRRFALQLLEEGMAHNVASDAHDTDGRPPTIASDLATARLGHLQEWLTELVPRAILTDERMPARPQPPPAPRGVGGPLRLLRRGR